jgi:hypothetical protein
VPQPPAASVGRGERRPVSGRASLRRGRGRAPAALGIGADPSTRGPGPDDARDGRVAIPDRAAEGRRCAGARADGHAGDRRGWAGGDGRRGHPPETGGPGKCAARRQALLPAELSNEALGGVSEARLASGDRWCGPRGLGQSPSAGHRLPAPGQGRSPGWRTRPHARPARRAARRELGGEWPRWAGAAKRGKSWHVEHLRGR